MILFFTDMINLWYDFIKRLLFYKFLIEIIEFNIIVYLFKSKIEWNFNF